MLLVALTITPIHAAQNNIYQNEHEAVIQELKKLREDGKGVGTYVINIQLSVDGVIKNQTIKVTLTDVNTKMYTNIAIDAKNIQLTEPQIKQLTTTELIAAVDAFAWNIDTLEELPIIYYYSDDALQELGEHQVRIGISENMYTTITVKITDNNFQVFEDYQIYYHEDVVHNETLPFFERFFIFLARFFLVLLFLVPLIFITIQYRVVMKYLQIIIDIFLKY